MVYFFDNLLVVSVETFGMTDSVGAFNRQASQTHVNFELFRHFQSNTSEFMANIFPVLRSVAGNAPAQA